MAVVCEDPARLAPMTEQPTGEAPPRRRGKCAGPGEGLRQGRGRGPGPRRGDRRPDEGRVHRHHGAVGLGQVDAHALPGRARHPDLRRGRRRRHRRSARLKDKDLTTLRRERIGFVFQSFNLVPTLTAEENILLPLDLAGRKADPEWFDSVIDAVGLAPAPGPPAQRDVRRPAAARGLCPGAREPAVDRLRRRAHRQPRLAPARPRCWASCGAASTSSARRSSW